MSDFDASFEASVLSRCLIDKKFLLEASRVLGRRSFSVPEHAWVWGVINSTWTKSSELATSAVFRSRAYLKFSKEEERKSHLAAAVKIIKLAGAGAGSPKAALEELRAFARACAVQEATVTSLKHQEKGEWDEAWGPIRNAIRNDLTRTDYEVSRWFEEWDDRQREREHRRKNPEMYRTIPTGFPKLDKRIGGAQEGELCSVMAVTNRGKSILAVNLGFTALLHGKGVIHFSTEMGWRKVAQRYDSRFSAMEYRKFKWYDFTDDDLEKLGKMVSRYRKKFDKQLRIVSTPSRSLDIDMVRRVIDEQRVEMARFDMLIVDSADHLQARGKYEKAYLAEASNYWDLKDLAEELDIPIWVTTQAKQEFENKMATTRAAAGAYDKSRICDLVISINEAGAKSLGGDGDDVVTHEDGDGKAKGSADDGEPEGDLQLYVAKNRDDEKGFKIPIETDLQRMLIREARKKDEPEPDPEINEEVTSEDSY